MKKILLTFVSVILVTIANGQETFNNRLSFHGIAPTVITSIEVTDSCYYVSGITNDTLPPHRLGVFLGKTTLEGEIEWYKTLLGPNDYYSAWNNTLTSDMNGDFLLTGRHVDTSGVGAILIKYDAEGDTIFIKKFISPYFPEEPFIALTSSHNTNDNGHLMVCNLHNEWGNTDNYLVKLDSLGNIEWDGIYGDTIISESNGAVLVLPDDRVLVTGHKTNTNFTGSNFISRVHLYEINQEGEIQWEYISPEGELWNRATDILFTADGGYLLATGKGMEETTPNPNLSNLNWHSAFLKLDADRNVEWSVDIRDSFSISLNTITKMIIPSDNSGYIGVGTIYNPNHAENGYDLNGTISKISNGGDSLWTRYYRYVESRADIHSFYDLEETTDGGFIMVGQATDNTPQAEDPPQRAWIVKVDQHGCLVPGCHLISPTIELQEVSFEIKTYPNPATDYLNVYFQHPSLKETAYFSLVDAAGKVVLAFESRYGDITHMVPVSRLASGSYWLTCRVGEAILTKGVLVE